MGVCMCLSLRLSRHSVLLVTSIPSGRFAALIRRDLACRVVIATHQLVMSSISQPSCASANALLAEAAKKKSDAIASLFFFAASAYLPILLLVLPRLPGISLFKPIWL